MLEWRVKCLLGNSDVRWPFSPACAVSSFRPPCVRPPLRWFCSGAGLQGLAVYVGMLTVDSLHPLFYRGQAIGLLDEG